MEKKFPEIISQVDQEWAEEGPLRVMFQDEARFGRISDTRRCWCPKPARPLCYSMVTQEYTYAYGAVSVTDGEFDSLILPHVNGDMMQIFLNEVASRHPKDRIVMILDGAGWHTSGLLSIPRNMRLLSLPRNSIRWSTSGTICVRSSFTTGCSKASMHWKITWRHRSDTWRTTRIGSGLSLHGPG